MPVMGLSMFGLRLCGRTHENSDLKSIRIPNTTRSKEIISKNHNANVAKKPSGSSERGMSKNNYRAIRTGDIVVTTSPKKSTINLNNQVVISSIICKCSTSRVEMKARIVTLF